jgi:hypothetical protein
MFAPCLLTCTDPAIRACQKWPIRRPDNLGEIITRLAGIADRFATALDCADTGFLPDGILDELPLPSAAGTMRTAGIDLNRPRVRAALAAAVALAPAPHGFTAAEFADRVRQMIRSPRPGRKPAYWTRVDRDYENLRIGMQELFGDLGISVSAAAA